MSAGTKRSNADEDNNDETPTNANTGKLILDPVNKSTPIYRSIFFRACDFKLILKTKTLKSTFNNNWT